MSISVQYSPIEGRGLFATRNLRRGTVVEVAPVLIVPSEQVDTVDETVLRWYVFDWDGEAHAVVLGKASMCNHSDEPNAELFLDDAEQGPVAELTVIRPVRAGEELLLDYGPDHPL
jgi:uncharacterized protein